MAFQGVKNYLYSLCQYFGISVSAEDAPSRVPGESPATGRMIIGPEGSSVDPEPFQLSPDPTSAPNAIQSTKIQDESDADDEPQLLKASLCARARDVSHDHAHDLATTDGGNQDYSGAGEIPVHPSAEEKSQKTKENILSESKEIAQTERTSASYLEKLIQLKREAEKRLPAARSTFQDTASGSQPTQSDGDVCALYRICPQLAPGAAVVAPPTQAQLRGRVTFNAPLFSEGDFELRIFHERVCLEFVQIDAEEIHGYVRLLNTTYVKHVSVDYTKNDWKIVRNCSAEWVESVNEGKMDRFKFTIPGRRSPGNLMFSVRFNGDLDDNKGHNYTVAYEHY